MEERRREDTKSQSIQDTEKFKVTAVKGEAACVCVCVVGLNNFVFPIGPCLDITHDYIATKDEIIKLFSDYVQISRYLHITHGSLQTTRVICFFHIARNKCTNIL